MRSIGGLAPGHKPRIASDRGAPWRFWLPFGAGLAIGAAGAGFIGSVHPAPAAPADQRASPPTPNELRPYAPPVRTGSGTEGFVLDALASASSSASLRRDGGAPLTATGAPTIFSGQRV